MHTLILDGKTVEINEKKFLELVSKLLEGDYVLVESYFIEHNEGFADLYQGFRLPQNGSLEYAVEIASQIKDRPLVELYHSLLKQRDSMISLDSEVMDWLAVYVKLPPPKSKKDLQTLRKRLRQIIIGGPGGSTQGPIWVFNEDYQVLVSKSTQVFDEFAETYKQAQDRIKTLIDEVKA